MGQSDLGPVPVAQQSLQLGGLRELDYLPDYLSSDYAHHLLQTLHAELAWKQEAITLYGRSVLQPRLTCWYGDAEAQYRYSGLQLQPLPWHRDLRVLRDRLQTDLGHRFNSVLANAYRSGADSMGWHADNEPELGQHPLIASISLGEERNFLLREGKRGKSRRLTLQHGSLLVMRGDLQRRCQHAVPKTTRQVGLRINLTFRYVLPAAVARHSPSD